MAKSALANVSIQEMEAEIQRRQRELEKLQSKRNDLAQKLEDVDQQIRQLEGEATSAAAAPKATRKGRKTGARRGRPAGGGGRRPKNEMNLADALAGVMSKDEPRRVSELAQAVVDAGYQTTSKNFRTIVNQTLVKEPRFKQVGRGEYVLAD